MSIEGITLEHFRALPKTDINSTTPSRQSHALFHYFLSDDSSQDAVNTTAQSKHSISFLKDKNY